LILAQNGGYLLALHMLVKQELKYKSSDSKQVSKNRKKPKRILKMRNKKI